MKWQLNPSEVYCGGSGGSSGGTFERKTKITTYSLWMEHQPTKIRVEGRVPPGHYSKKEMQKLKLDLNNRLFAELEQKVAKHLRIAGR